MIKVKWYMRLLLVFHRLYSKEEKYQKKGKGLIVTTTYKVCCDSMYMYSLKQELFHLAGKHMRRARRHK